MPLLSLGFMMGMTPRRQTAGPAPPPPPGIEQLPEDVGPPEPPEIEEPGEPGEGRPPLLPRPQTRRARPPRGK